MQRKSAVAQAIEQNLEELHRRHLLESLRPHVLHSESDKSRRAPITMDDLRVLCRMWKMDQRRNFWRLHPTQHDLVLALHEYIQENLRFSSTFAGGAGTEGNMNREPSSAGHREGSSSIRPIPPTNTRTLSSKEQSPRSAMVNYFGRKQFDREVTPNELVLRSRFYSFPSDHGEDDSENKASGGSRSVRDVLRMSLEKSSSLAQKSRKSLEVEQSPQKAMVMLQSIAAESLEKGLETEHARARLMKHRTLAGHLVRFSARRDLDLSQLPPKAVHVFVTLTISQDSLTVTRGLMALSNICCDRNVRAILLKDGMLSTIASLISSTEGQWFMSLIYYYFSCDLDVDEAAASIYQAIKRVLTESLEMKLLSLETLSNLLASSERSKAMELLMTALSGVLESMQSTDGLLLEPMLLTVISALANLCSFTHLHLILLDYGILNIISTIKTIAATAADIDQALLQEQLSRLLTSFLHEGDLMVTLLQYSYIDLMLDVLGYETAVSFSAVLRSLAVVSRERLNAQHFCGRELLQTLVTEMVKIPMSDAARDDYYCTAVLLCNISMHCSIDELPGVADRFLEYTLSLVQHYKEDVGRICLQTLVNMFTDPDVCLRFGIPLTMEVLSRAVDAHGDGEAARCLFNLALVPECRSLLVLRDVHLLLLDKACCTSVSPLRCAALQGLMHLVEEPRCVADLVEREVLRGLRDMCSTDPLAWLDATRLLRTLVSLTSISEDDLDLTLQLLSMVCSNQTPGDVIIECAMILAYLSLGIPDFTQLDGVIKAIVSISDNPSVLESLACLLYNVACTTTPTSILLQDKFYLDVMINMMRTGSPTIQKDIGEAIRTLTTFERGCQILLDDVLLPDLIVVALLLTTSPEIQYICNESFSNLFTHKQYRVRLLKSDICWAMVNLCRKNGAEVRASCGRVFLNLSCSESHLALIRQNQLLPFVREVTANADNSTAVVTDFVWMGCNIAMQLHKSMSIADLKTVLAISLDALSLHPESMLCIPAVRLLLKCAEVDLRFIMQEYAASHFDELLLAAADVWTRDAGCVDDLTRLFVLLSRDKTFSHLMPWAALDRLFEAVLQSSNAPGVEALENMTLCLFQYTATAAQPLVVLQSITASSLIVHGFITHKSKGIVFNESLAALLVYILAFEIEEVVGYISDLVSPLLMEYILSTFTQQAEQVTKRNMFVIIEACIRDGDASVLLIGAGIFKFLFEQILTPQTATQEEFEICAFFFFHMAVSIPLRSLIVDAPFVDALVQTIVDSGFESAYLPLMAGLYHLSSGYLSDEKRLSPTVVQEATREMSQASTRVDDPLYRLSRQVTAIVLDTYSLEGIHPTFVSQMYADMQKTEGSDVSDIFHSLKSTHRHMEAGLPQNVTGNNAFNIFSTQHQRQGFNSFASSSPEWRVTSFRARKLMDLGLLSVISESTSAFISEAKKYLVPELAAYPVGHLYHKLLKIYPRVFVDKDDGTSLAFHSVVVTEPTTPGQQRRRKSRQLLIEQENREKEMDDPGALLSQRTFRRRCFFEGVVVSGTVDIGLEDEEDRSATAPALQSDESIANLILHSSETSQDGHAIAYRENIPDDDISLDSRRATECYAEDLRSSFEELSVEQIKSSGEDLVNVQRDEFERPEELEQFKEAMVHTSPHTSISDQYEDEAFNEDDCEVEERPEAEEELEEDKFLDEEEEED